MHAAFTLGFSLLPAAVSPPSKYRSSAHVSLGTGYVFTASDVHRPMLL